MEAAVCGPPGAELRACKRTLMLKSSSNKNKQNKPHKTLPLFTAFSASDVQPRTWIYQPLLDLDPGSSPTNTRDLLPAGAATWGGV